MQIHGLRSHVFHKDCNLQRTTFSCFLPLIITLQKKHFQLLFLVFPAIFGNNIDLMQFWSIYILAVNYLFLNPDLLFLKWHEVTLSSSGVASASFFDKSICSFHYYDSCSFMHDFSLSPGLEVWVGRQALGRCDEHLEDRWKVRAASLWPMTTHTSCSVAALWAVVRLSERWGLYLLCLLSCFPP